MDTATLDELPGQGETKTVTSVLTRHECAECGEDAHFKHLLRGLRRKLFRGGITAADWDVIDAYLSRKEQ